MVPQLYVIKVKYAAEWRLFKILWYHLKFRKRQALPAISQNVVSVFPYPVFSFVCDGKKLILVSNFF
jgi:hypothetical protein